MSPAGARCPGVTLATSHLIRTRPSGQEQTRTLLLSLSAPPCIAPETGVRNPLEGVIWVKRYSSDATESTWSGPNPRCTSAALSPRPPLLLPRARRGPS